ncbi:hypothetical protein B0T14DRAFT_511428 [Immersiella caudata]|uniref:Uncharacterized protein n=1 Tax=Immersiella caudata TaxID=314043 RepID=A0AA39X4U4_9PEZI|nr:hypothetical protein B0T14DRAFT_511428 [Immersiella caudata]
MRSLRSSFFIAWNSIARGARVSSALRLTGPLLRHCGIEVEASCNTRRNKGRKEGQAGTLVVGSRPAKGSPQWFVRLLTQNCDGNRPRDPVLCFYWIVAAAVRRAGDERGNF